MVSLSNHGISTMPLLTVLVPNYNHAAFLEQRMQSLLQQTWQDFDIILMDDCSTDNSRSILEQYRQHPRVKQLVYNTQNSGSPMAQWFKGIALAETEWVYIAESDDTCHPRLFEDLAPRLQQPNLVLALTEVQYINEQHDVILQFPPLGKQQLPGRRFVQQYMLRNCYLCNSGMAIFRKSAVPAAGPWQQALRYSPDYYFWIALMLKGDVYNNGQIMANFRKHAREFTHGKWDSLTEHTDHARMLHLLWQQQLLTATDIKNTIQFKLVGLATRRKGMAPADYAAYTQCWLQLAKDCGLHIPAWRIGWQAFQRKLAHRLRS